MTRKQSIHHVLEGETLEGINGVYRSLENHFNDPNNNEINTHSSMEKYVGSNDEAEADGLSFVDDLQLAQAMFTPVSYKKEKPIFAISKTKKKPFWR